MPQWGKKSQRIRVLVNRDQKERKKEGSASRVEQRMRDEQCWSDVAEEAKEGQEEEKTKLEVDG